MLKRVITPKTINVATTAVTGLIGFGLLAAGYRSAAKEEQNSSSTIKHDEPKNSVASEMKP